MVTQHQKVITEVSDLMTQSGLIFLTSRKRLDSLLIRWIWVTHAQRLYGDDMMYGDPQALLSHIKSEFFSRLEWDRRRIMHKHAMPHSATAKQWPQAMLKHRWGKVATCNTQGNKVSVWLTMEQE